MWQCGLTQLILGKYLCYSNNACHTGKQKHCLNSLISIGQTLLGILVHILLQSIDQLDSFIQILSVYKLKLLSEFYKIVLMDSCEFS